MRNYIQKTKDTPDWQLGNDILYELCKNHHGHKNDNEIRAKIWLIGRSYAAAIERRKIIDGNINDDFYSDVVVPKIKESSIDDWIESCKKEMNTESAIRAHHKLTKLFYEISNLDKRSLASKYLHFHIPSIFYIYDTRAVGAIKELYQLLRIKKPKFHIQDECDKNYAEFFKQCEFIVNYIKKNMSILLTPRQLDNVLISLGNKKLRNILLTESST